MAFDPSKRHPHYVKWLEKWIRQRDVVEGEDKVKAKGDIYLPRLSGQASSESSYRANPKHVLTSYEAYKRRASFMNATGRTVEGLVGAVMRKDPDVNWPSSEEDLLDDVGYETDSFEEIAHQTLDEVIGIGRYGHLVDMPPEGGEPFIATYVAESITNWELRRVDGRKQPTMVILQESPRGQTKDGRDLEVYRVLRLGAPTLEIADNEEPSPGDIEEFLASLGLSVTDFQEGLIYFQEIWVELEVDQESDSSNKERRFMREQVIIPRSNGGAFWREIPFTFFNPRTNKPKPEKPILMDMSVVNLGHYRNSADHEHGLHFTALPQAWIAGFRFDGELFVGSGVAWVSEEPGATAGYLEFSGQGLSAIKDEMNSKEKRMAFLGARLLEKQPKPGGGESTETVKIRTSGERSALHRVAISVSAGLTRDLQFLRQFKGKKDKVGVKLNTDFGVEGLSPEMLNALMQQVQSGQMSWDVYFFNAKRGELYPDNWTPEEEARAIQSGAPGDSLEPLLEPRTETVAPEEPSDVNEPDQ